MGTFYSFIHSLCVSWEATPCQALGRAWRMHWYQAMSFWSSGFTMKTDRKWESGIIVEPETRCCRHIKWAMKSTALSKWAKLGCAIRNLYLSGLSNKQLSHAYVTCIAQVWGPTFFQRHSPSGRLKRLHHLEYCHGRKKEAKKTCAFKSFYLRLLEV